MITKKKLDAFCKLRNESPFSNNMQFQSDCEEAGFKISELGGCEKIANGHYQWDIPVGAARIILTEKNGQMSYVAQL